MQTAKTAIVTVLLLTILYAAYVAINAPPLQPPEEIAGLINEGGEFDMNIDDGSLVPQIETPDFPEIQIPETGGVNASLSDNSASGSVSDTSSGLPPLNFGAPVNTTNTELAAPTPTPSIELPPLPDNSVSATPVSSNNLNADPNSPILTAALPKPEPVANPVLPDLEQNYPETPLASLSLTAPGILTPADAEAAPNAGGSVGDEAAPSEDIVVPGEASVTDQTSAAPSGDKNSGFANAIASADRQVAAGELKEALFTLSLFYGSPDLSAEQLGQLMPRLNALAGEVIYSRRHLVESAHRVQAGETLQTIATARKLPTKLLANINGLNENAPLAPGTELKVLTGPFRAEVNLTKSELALFVSDLFAGSFKIETGASPAPQEGTFAVQGKQEARAFYGLDGTTFASGDPKNPYGEVWLDLGNRVSIHGSARDTSAPNRGCIQLQTADARDIYGILSEGSAVTIRR